MKFQELEREIQQCKDEIVSLESATIAVEQDLPRPREAVGDRAFDLLKQHLEIAAEEQSPEAKEGERKRKKAQAIKASRDAIAQAKARLQEKEQELSELQSAWEQAKAELHGSAEKVQQLSLSLEAELSNLQLLRDKHHTISQQATGKSVVEIRSEVRELPEVRIYAETGEIYISSLSGLGLFSRLLKV